MMIRREKSSPSARIQFGTLSVEKNREVCLGEVA